VRPKKGEKNLGGQKKFSAESGKFGSNKQGAVKGQVIGLKHLLETSQDSHFKLSDYLLKETSW